MSVYENICNEVYTPVVRNPEYSLKKLDTEAYVKARQEYKAANEKCMQQFKVDCLKEVGLTDHPKADQIFAFAWSNWHADGLTDVLHYLRDLADLFRG